MFNNIRLYPFDTEENDEEEIQLNETIRVRLTLPLLRTYTESVLAEHDSVCGRRL